LDCRLALELVFCTRRRPTVRRACDADLRVRCRRGPGAPSASTWMAAPQPGHQGSSLLCWPSATALPTTAATMLAAAQRALPFHRPLCRRPWSPSAAARAAAVALGCSRLRWRPRYSCCRRPRLRPPPPPPPGAPRRRGPALPGRSSASRSRARGRSRRRGLRLPSGCRRPRLLWTCAT